MFFLLLRINEIAVPTKLCIPEVMRCCLISSAAFRLVYISCCFFVVRFRWFVYFVSFLTLFVLNIIKIIIQSYHWQNHWIYIFFNMMYKYYILDTRSTLKEKLTTRRKSNSTYLFFCSERFVKQTIMFTW